MKLQGRQTLKSSRTYVDKKNTPKEE